MKKRAKKLQKDETQKGRSRATHGLLSTSPTIADTLTDTGEDEGKDDVGMQKESA